MKYLEVSAAERDEYDRKAQNDHGVTIIIPPMKPWLDVAKTVFDALRERRTSCRRAWSARFRRSSSRGRASEPAAMHGFRKVLAAIGFVELWVAIAAFVFVVVLTMTQVLYRYLLAGSIWWAQEIAQLAMLVAYFFGIAYVYKAKQDIIVGFLVSRLSRRIQVALAIFTQISDRDVLPLPRGDRAGARAGATRVLHLYPQHTRASIRRCR